MDKKGRRMTEEEAMDIQEAARRIYNAIPKSRRSQHIGDLALIQRLVTAILRGGESNEV